MSDTDEPITLVEPVEARPLPPIPENPTLADVMREIREMRTALGTTADEVIRIGQRLNEVADLHGSRLKDLERGALPASSGNGVATQ